MAQQQQRSQSDKYSHTLPDYQDDQPSAEGSRSSSNNNYKLLVSNSYGGLINSARSFKTSTRSVQNKTNNSSSNVFLLQDINTKTSNMDKLNMNSPINDYHRLPTTSPMNERINTISSTASIQKKSMISEFKREVSTRVWEEYLDQIRSATSVDQLTQDNQFLQRLKYSINQALTHIKLIEENDRITKKEIQKIQKINEFLTISTNKKDEIYKEAVKENIQIKQQLRNVTEALKRKEDKFLLIQQKFGNINDINDLQNPLVMKESKKPEKKDVYKQPRNIEYGPKPQFQQIQSIQPSKQQSLQPSLSQAEDLQNDYNLNDQRLQKQLSDIKLKHMNHTQSIFIGDPQVERRDPEVIIKNEEFQPPQIVNLGLNDPNNEELHEFKPEQIKTMSEENDHLLYIQQQANPHEKSRKNSSMTQNTQRIENHFDSDEDDIIQKTRFNFVQHSTDFYFFALLLDLNINDSQIMQYFTSHKNVGFIQENLSTPEKFLNLLSNLNKDNFQMMFESIKYQKQIAEIAVKVIIKLKKIIQVVSNINSQILVPDAFDVIINETCRIIDCDRSSVFLADYDRQELWTKVAKGTNTIRVSLSKGLVGHVATKGETLNILDAHKDYRFNRDVDKKTNYKTKSVLCVPIFDKNRNNIVGVLQAINKNNQSFFSKDDEGLIHILAAVAQQLLRNSMFNDQNQSFQQNLRSLLSIGFKLNRFKSVEELLPQAEYLLSKTFDISECRIYLHKEATDKLVRYVSSSEVQEFDLSIGLVGEAFTQGFTVNVSNAYSHNRFNNLIDINTSMPVTCLPIYAQKSATAKVKIGVITVVNQKGIEGISYRMNQSLTNLDTNKNVNSIKPAIGSTFEETISTFGQIVSQIVVNIQKVNLDEY